MPLTDEQKARKAIADKARRERNKAAKGTVTRATPAKTAKKPKAPSPFAGLGKAKPKPAAKVAHGGKRASSGNKPGWSGVKTKVAAVVIAARVSPEQRVEFYKRGVDAFREWLDTPLKAAAKR